MPSFVGSITRVPEGSEWIVKVFSETDPSRFSAGSAELAAELAAASPTTPPEVKVMLVGVMQGKLRRRRGQP